MIPPGRKIGVLGGGQLGTFFTIAAKRLGYRVTVWDPNSDAPAHAWADTSVKSAFDSQAALQTFIGEADAVTFEWENIPVNLVRAIEERRPVRPGSAVLSLLQNRVREKEFLDAHNLPVTLYRAVLKQNELTSAAKQLGFPLICKTATAGYDGIGQWRLTRMEDVCALSAALAPRETGWILEKVAPFTKELSIIAARSKQGDVVTYPVTENLHEAGILRLCRMPADIPLALSQKISALAVEVLSALQGVGLFCIELFLLENEVLLINEIAPRPHNSGHYTLDAVHPSQYEQQVRVLCGLPLPQPAPLSSAVMVNLLGAEILAIRQPEYTRKLFAIPGARMYDYRKKEIKDRRKMGHVSLIGQDPKDLLSRAEAVCAILRDARNHTDSG
ncbi:MAG: 5-(carboxyamino)imidazole ribonucleotide synthase [Nitrospiria bacterium]